jgi:hypothetical protein
VSALDEHLEKSQCLAAPAHSSKIHHLSKSSLAHRNESSEGKPEKLQVLDNQII